MTSKKILEYLYNASKIGITSNENAKILKDYYKLILKDLDRLEKLEKDYEKLKERYKHRAEVSNDLCKGVKQYENIIEKIISLPHCDICDADWHNGCMCLKNKLKEVLLNEKED